MEITSSQISAEVFLATLRTFFHHKGDQLRHAQARRRVYRDTLHELSRLTDRDLADLGIPRSNIRRLAREAANDV